jgi:eukaryotic-like serine/threonine-protein kinase
MSRDIQAGPASIPPAQRGERFASGLRVRGRYRVVNEIGAGAFGTVCVGEDESTGHRVAIRFLPRNFATTPQASQAVLRMGRSIIAASTSHPAMARVLEFGELDAGRPFTVTEFVEGRRLSEMISGRAPIDIAAALRIMLELGGAVETLHNMGFIHGAVSPRNVVVLEDGRVKLLDIELSGLRDAREVQGLLNIDPPAEYLSPEQIQKAPITEKTDVYAFGVILHEVLSGAPPFQGATREAIYAKHLKEAPVPIHRRRDGVSASVGRAVSLTLYKQPEARPLMGDVLNLLWTGAHGPAPRSKRAAMIAGGAALAALAVVAVVWGVLALRPPAGSSPVQPTARPPIETLPPTPAPPAVETRKSPAPAVVTPHEGRAPLTNPPPSNDRAPEPAVAPQPRPSPPAVSAPPVEGAAPAARMPSATAPTESRPAPAVRSTTPPVATPAPTVAPPAAQVAPPAPAVVSPSPAVTSPARPATPAPAQATPPAAPRVERREQTQAPPAPAITTPQRTPSTETDDSGGAAIDWLLKSRSQ